MEFWNKEINVSKESAEQQIAIINKFSSEKRLSIALDFVNFGIDRTREWIRNSNPGFSELEINLEFVRSLLKSQNVLDFSCSKNGLAFISGE